MAVDVDGTVSLCINFQLEKETFTELKTGQYPCRICLFSLYHSGISSYDNKRGLFVASLDSVKDDESDVANFSFRVEIAAPAGDRTRRRVEGITDGVPSNLD